MQRINISSPEVDIERSMTEIRKVLESGQMAQGPIVLESERLMAQEFGANHGALVSNGTVSLRAALIAGVATKYQVKPSMVDRFMQNGEIIVPAFSFNATLNAVIQSGAKARVVDINPDDFCINEEQTQSLITEETVAIMPVDLYGQASSISNQNFGVLIIRDSAQAHGAELNGRPIVKHADAVSTSFYPTKNVAGGGEGGGILSDNEDLIEIVKIYRNQGMSKQYQYEMIGDNLRMTDLQAVILKISLEGMRKANELRTRNAQLLTEGLSSIEGIKLPMIKPNRTHVWHQYTICVDSEVFGMNRDELRTKLDKKGIGSGIYYPKTMTDHPSYLNHPRIIVHPTPEADKLAKQVLSLPVHPKLTENDILRITETITKIQNKGR